MIYDKRSCYLCKHDGWFRKKIVWLSCWPWFDNFIIILILVNTITLDQFDPTAFRALMVSLFPLADEAVIREVLLGPPVIVQYQLLFDSLANATATRATASVWCGAATKAEAQAASIKLRKEQEAKDTMETAAPELAKVVSAEL